MNWDQGVGAIRWVCGYVGASGIVTNGEDSTFYPTAETGTKVEGTALGGCLLSDFGKDTLGKELPINLANAYRPNLTPYPGQPGYKP